MDTHEIRGKLLLTASESQSTNEQLLKSEPLPGLNDDKTLFGVQNGITSLTLQVANHLLSQPRFAQHPVSSQIVFLQRNLPPLSREKECH
jgi:hypothetical protein